MEFIKDVIDLFLHLDVHLNTVISDYGMWTYLILFLIIFCETGLVVTPILPGDSLLFAAGTFAAIGSLDVTWLFILLTIAAVLGVATFFFLLALSLIRSSSAPAPQPQRGRWHRAARGSRRSPCGA